MSFIGNIAAAESAKAIGKYNSSVAYEEAQYARKKNLKGKIKATIVKGHISSQD